MVTVFTKQKGIWRFFAFVKSKESLDVQLKFLDDDNIEHKEIFVPSLDFNQISTLEDKLNQE